LRQVADHPLTSSTANNLALLFRRLGLIFFAFPSLAPVLGCLVGVGATYPALALHTADIGGAQLYEKEWVSSLHSAVHSIMGTPTSVNPALHLISTCEPSFVSLPTMYPLSGGFGSSHFASGSGVGLAVVVVVMVAVVVVGVVMDVVVVGSVVGAAVVDKVGVVVVVPASVAVVEGAAVVVGETVGVDGTAVVVVAGFVVGPSVVVVVGPAVVGGDDPVVVAAFDVVTTSEVVVPCSEVVVAAVIVVVMEAAVVVSDGAEGEVVVILAGVVVVVAAGVVTVVTGTRVVDTGSAFVVEDVVVVVTAGVVVISAVVVAVDVVLVVEGGASVGKSFHGQGRHGLPRESQRARWSRQTTTRKSTISSLSEKIFPVNSPISPACRSNSAFKDSSVESSDSTRLSARRSRSRAE